MAAALVMTPSTGMTSPARTKMSSPTATCSIGTSSMIDAIRRWAIFGVRSIKDRRSRAARAKAKSSKRLPPEYMMAMTIPAKFCPSTSAPDIDTSATASTPKRPARKSRIMEPSNPTTTGIVPAAQHQFAQSFRPTPQAARPRRRPASAIAASARRNSLWFTSTVRFDGLAILGDIGDGRSRRLIPSASILSATNDPLDQLEKRQQMSDLSSKPRVTPPNTHSPNRVCPYAPATIRSTPSPLAMLIS